MPSINYLPLIDTHAHINLEDFKDDFEDLLKRSRLGQFPAIKGRQVEDSVLKPFISGLICPAVDLETTRTALDLSQRYNFIFTAAGFHPNHTSMIKPGDWEECKQLVLNSQNPQDPNYGKIVALGETGLDRYWDDAPFDLQKEYFLKTLTLGLDSKLPVIIHSRDANEDLMNILRDFYSSKSCQPQKAKGVVHSFSGTIEQAEELIEMGFYLGFGGFVTYTSKKFAELWNVAKQVPCEKFLLETDCPFLTPHPLRGKLERNEPLTTAFVARRLAELRNVSTKEIVFQTRENAIRLFKLPQLADKPETSI